MTFWTIVLPVVFSATSQQQTLLEEIAVGDLPAADILSADICALAPDERARELNNIRLALGQLENGATKRFFERLKKCDQLSAKDERSSPFSIGSFIESYPVAAFSSIACVSSIVVPLITAAAFGPLGLYLSVLTIGPAAAIFSSVGAVVSAIVSEKNVIPVFVTTIPGLAVGIGSSIATLWFFLQFFEQAWEAAFSSRGNSDMANAFAFLTLFAFALQITAGPLVVAGAAWASLQ